MAIFYEHIKGLAIINNAEYYSYINWTDGAPTFTFGNTNKGAFLLAGTASSAYSYNIYSSLTFKTAVTFSGGEFDNYFSINKDGISTATSFNFKNGNTSFITITPTQFTSNITGTVNGLNSPNVFGGGAYFGNGIGVNGNAIISGYCNATYFNSTSDARAKENIVAAEFDAVDLVKHIPVYCFTYKDKPADEYSIGIIAQDAVSKPADKFELVSNQEASGENGDYMSVKESKLVYILWKAVQEQAKQIEELTDTIEQMKKDLSK